MRWLPVLASLLLAVACARPDPVVHDAFPALGTLVEVTIRGGFPDSTLRDVRDGFARAQHEWHAWGDGGLGRLNDGATVPTDDLAPLLARAEEMRDASGGLFEPHIGALVEAWGFHDEAALGRPPPEDAIAAWVAGGLRARIDLGAIAKGAAVGDARATLAAAGVTHALVNAGGDIAALGDAGGRPWRIGIRDPRGVGVVAGLDLGDGECVFTSGDYERRYEYAGETHHHILDPRTGRPARGTASVSVVHTDPTLADAAATALFVAGDAWPRVAEAMGVVLVLRIRADGGIEATDALARRVRLQDPGRSIRIVETRADPR